ncbi:MAG: UDP-2-acetamido-3-amino-2,3-dideoxy-glucuronate N-acetyltransferase [Actinomycetota bacterium]|nr:UDP-2-acetamido-3-amino-2,3-dideoxy-glucuronate N-acetyltransferase [Actinomycetota bacterium]
MSATIHPDARVESDDIGDGTRVWAFAHVLEGAHVGRDCNVCDHVFIESGVVIGDRVTIKNAVLLWDGVVVEDDVFIGPGAVFTNDRNPRASVKKARHQFDRTLVKANATIGANATIVAGVTVGESAFVGAGAVVVADVPPFALVFGNPAHQAGWMCSCATRLPEDLRCPGCGLAYAVGQDGLVLT